MRHLPKTEYTEADQRSDTSFLVGCSYGRESAKATILAAARERLIGGEFVILGELERIVGPVDLVSRSEVERKLSHARACLREIATANNGYLSIREVNEMLRSVL